MKLSKTCQNFNHWIWHDPNHFTFPKLLHANRLCCLTLPSLHLHICEEECIYDPQTSVEGSLEQIRSLFDHWNQTRQCPGGPLRAEVSWSVFLSTSVSLKSATCLMLKATLLLQKLGENISESTFSTLIICISHIRWLQFRKLHPSLGRSLTQWIVSISRPYVHDLTTNFTLSPRTYLASFVLRHTFF